VASLPPNGEAQLTPLPVGANFGEKYRGGKPCGPETRPAHRGDVGWLETEWTEDSIA
jgi:hypothetical protein